MAKLIVQVAAVLVAAALAADAVVVVVGRKRSVSVEGLPGDCQAEVDVEKRDNPNEIDFVVCVRNGKVCTSRDVSPCSSVAQFCDSFKPSADKDFKRMFPKAYAKVCVEPYGGEQCLYTDVKYKTCDMARTMNDNEICITLSNGEVECAEVPDEYLLQRIVQNANNRVSAEEKLPQYRPDAIVQDRLPQYKPTYQTH